MTPGTLVGKYRLLRQLGRGAMGEVWAAVNVDTDREVALKLITSPAPELRRRLLREARAIGRLDHPNIVQILDRGETPQGEPFLVMQLLQGETLGDRLRRDRTLPEPVAAGIALDIARALRVAHEKEIVHRDLKPANIFLHREPDTEEDVVKVVDFGVSKLSIDNEGAATVQGGLVGSPAYMSPEQVRSAAVDGRTDVWALGVMLFEMLAGERPFRGPTSVVVLTQILDPEHIPRLEVVAPRVNRGLCAVVAACLERDPAKRVPSAMELSRLLRPFATRGRHATIEASAARERFASVPEPQATTSEPAPRQVRESDAETGIYRPSMLSSAALERPQAAGAGTVLIGGPAKQAQAQAAERDSTVTFWQPGMVADSAHGDTPSVDEGDRATTEVLKPGVLPSPAARAAPAGPSPQVVREPPATMGGAVPAYDSGSWPRPPQASPASPGSGSWPRVEPAYTSAASSAGPPVAAPLPHAAAAPDLSPAQRKRVFATTQPLPPTVHPPAGAENIRGGTLKIEPEMLAPILTAARNPWQPPPASAVTTTTAPFAGPPPPLPVALATQPQPPRRWPLMLLAASTLALVAAVGMLVVTLREELGSPAPAASSAVVPTAAASSAQSAPMAPSELPSAAPILPSASASATSSAPAPSASSTASVRPAVTPTFRPHPEPPF